jgi:hypothetical protein
MQHLHILAGRLESTRMHTIKEGKQVAWPFMLLNIHSIPYNYQFVTILKNPWILLDCCSVILKSFHSGIKCIRKANEGKYIIFKITGNF